MRTEYSYKNPIFVSKNDAIQKLDELKIEYVDLSIGEMEEILSKHFKKDYRVNKRLNVISPDGFSIEYDGAYTSIEEAESAFNQWKQRYNRQGYYSSTTQGRIPLEDLEEYCTLVEIDYEEEFENNL